MEKQQDGVLNWFGKLINTPKESKVILTEKEYKNLKSSIKKYRKSFEAVKSNFLQGNWVVGNSRIDADIYNDQERLVQLARNLEQNNPIMKKFLTEREINIVGATGFVLNSQAKDFNNGQMTLDIIGNKVIEDSYNRWSKAKFCDITGKHSFREIQRILERTRARDGEVLIRIIRGKATKDNPYGFSLQILDPQRLDISYNANLDNGSVIKMGIELNQFGKPIAYHLRLKEQQSVVNGSYNTALRERVVAKDIIHKFKATSTEQTRGYPEGHAVFALMADLQEFMRAALIASKIGASSSIYLQRTDESGNTTIDALADIVEEDDELENFIMEVSPGDIRVLPKNTEMKTFDAKYPEANFVNYVQFMLKQIASGLNVSYFVLSNSLESVNYTSSRTGLISERDGYKREQDWFIENILEPIYEDWLETAMLNNAIKLINGSTIPVTKLDKFLSSYRFHGRRWDWVDPLKDANANVILIENGLASRTQILAEQGVEYEDILADMKYEKELRASYGIEEHASTLDTQQVIDSLKEEVPPAPQPDNANLDNIQ
jgi:lambda family phage portal protein